MSVIRAIRDDLVEKRLWPVALVLVLALIAAPVLAMRASGGATPPPPTTTPVAPVQAAPSAQQPAVLNQKKQAAPSGQYHDPFRNGKAVGGASSTSTAGVATTVTPDATKSSSSGSSGSAASTPASSGEGPCFTCSGTSGSATTVASGPEPTPSPSSSGSGTSVPSTPVTPTKSSDPVSTSGYAAGYDVDVDWGPVADPKSVDNLTRLHLLRAADQPQVVFLGVRDDGKHALFLITLQHVSADGDGRCLPTADHCHVVQMAVGDSQLIDIPTSVGMAQYELVVDHLAQRRAATFAKGTDLRNDYVKAGAKLVNHRINAGFNFVRRFTFVERRGVLVYHP